jgi:hypothetical protein
VPADEHNAPAEPEHAASAGGRNAAPLVEDESARLLASLYASFTSTYLTLTSVIQGVALAYLVVVVDVEMHAFEAAHWILVVATFDRGEGAVLAAGNVGVERGLQLPRFGERLRGAFPLPSAGGSR